MKKITSWPVTILLAVIMFYYLCLSLVPMSWFWYQPGSFSIANSPLGTSPEVTFTRWVKRDTQIGFSVVIRPAGGGTIVCDAHGGPFTYTAATTPNGPSILTTDLGWWADNQCDELPVGDYVIDTCWTASNLLYGILPPKTVCTGPHFFRIT